MKHFISCLIICVISITILIWVKIDTRQKELEMETYIKILQMEEQIEMQNREIRLLRQDMEIIENGWAEQ